VAVGPDGAYYVGQLTGFPFPVGGARVFRVVPGHRPQVFARGFTNIIDIAFDRHGRLHVLEIASDGILAGAARCCASGRGRNPRVGGHHPDGVMPAHPSGGHHAAGLDAGRPWRA
jgi:hypothetical protein